MSPPSPFEEAARAVRALAPRSRIRVVAARDGDGVAAAAILARAFRRAGRDFHITYEAAATDELFSALAREPHEALVVLGLGDAFGARLGRFPGAVVVVDGQPGPAGRPGARGPHHLRPEARGPRTPASSAAAQAFAWVLALDAANEDLAPIALVGAWAARGGERPDEPQAVDAHALAARRGLVRDEVGLALPEAPLVDAFRALPGVWADAGADVGSPADFLAAQGLAPDANVHELGRADLEVFTSLVVVRGLRRGVPPESLGSLIRRVPRSVSHGGLPVPRIASLVSSAAAEGEGSLALAFLLGDASLLGELEAIEARHHEPHHLAAHGHGGNPHA